MRSLYWKIFLSFWLATILIIVTTAWFTSEIARKSSIPAHERLFMDSYANAAVATFETGHLAALTHWLKHTSQNKNMNLFLLTSQGKVIGNQEPPALVKKIALNLSSGQLDSGIFKSGKLIVSHEILSTSGIAYRLAAVSEKPLSHFVQIPWADLTARLLIAIFISGLICYLLSIYLTQPLRSLRLAAQSLAKGKLNTRVGRFAGHHNDEIAGLSYEFDCMAEQLENLIHSKQQLLQDISHELRSPLARLHVAIALARQKSTPLAEGDFNRMEEECLRLNTLIGEALDFARLDKSSNTLNRVKVDLALLIHRIINDANYEFAGMKQQVVVDKMEACQLMLEERLIHRAIENILRNALHYSPPNSVVMLSLYRPNETFIQIDIADNGPGVPEDQLVKIFSPFYRVDSARDKKTGGYGLGLAIAAEAVKLHGGDIQATNRPSGGLLVRIRIPAT